MGSTPHQGNRATKSFGACALIAGFAMPVALTLTGTGVAAAAPDSGPVMPQPSVVSNYQSPLIRNAHAAMRPMPDQRYLAPMRMVHLPTTVAPVAPILAPTGKIRIGSLMVDRLPLLNDGQVAGIDNTAAGGEATIATFADSIGLDPTRSDLVAADVLADSAIGASAASSTVGMPLATAGAVVGGVAGLIAGVPFLPIGLVLGPIAGAAIGATVTAAPFVLLGGAIGAAVGVGQALLAPASNAPAALPPHHNHRR